MSLQKSWVPGVFAFDPIKFALDPRVSIKNQMFRKALH